MEILLHAAGLAFIPVICYVIFLGIQDILQELEISLSFDLPWSIISLGQFTASRLSKSLTLSPDVILHR